MSVLKSGEWVILSVAVNAETVMNYEGFINLEISEDELVIQPIDMRFAIQSADSDGAVLESKGQLYNAVFEVDDNGLEITLTRPELTETVVISAKHQVRHVCVS